MGIAKSKSIEKGAFIPLYFGVTLGVSALVGLVAGILIDQTWELAFLAGYVGTDFFIHVRDGFMPHDAVNYFTNSLCNRRHSNLKISKVLMKVNMIGDFFPKELEDFESPYGTGIERDLDFEECPSSEIVTRVQPRVDG